MKNKSFLHYKALAALAVSMFGAPWQMIAQASASAYNTSADTYLTNIVLLLIAGLLLIPIYLLGDVFVLSIRMKIKASKPLSAIFFLAFGGNLMAQSANTESGWWSSFDAISYILFCVIVFELIVIFSFAIGAKRILAEQINYVPAQRKIALVKWMQGFWQRINKFQPIEAEAKIDTGHSYDGIRELDNITPPWFTTAFIATIIFAVIYLWRYHVTDSAPLMYEEFEIAMAKAEAEKAERLKSQANLVDETNVTMLGQTDILKGANLFSANCAACHGQNGASSPGGVGPNLSDLYTIHGNELADIFKTIKYGYPERGMRAWKDDLSPMQIAQITSYIKSIEGKNFANGKEPQGNLIVLAGEDSTGNHTLSEIN